MGRAALKVTGRVGSYLADKIVTIIERIVKNISIKSKPLVIAVDDITRAIGLDKVEWYIKWLYEIIGKINEEYNPGSIFIIVTTSEGESFDLVRRHTYAKIRLIWNLPKEGFKELLNILDPLNRVLEDKLWNVTGGNPRNLIEIAYDYNWNIDMWLLDLKDRLRPLIEVILYEKLVGELLQVIEDPDFIYKGASYKVRKLKELLIRENLIIYNTGI